eukprot:scaffold11979_cov108-Isochrysis_galbana.AAC.3
MPQQHLAARPLLPSPGQVAAGRMRWGVQGTAVRARRLWCSSRSPSRPEFSFGGRHLCWDPSWLS